MMLIGIFTRKMNANQPHQEIKARLEEQTKNVSEITS
jgi:hypothetical protein